MACYQSLPLEIRQYILQIVILEDGLFLKPQSRYLSNLILVNRQTFVDVKSVLSVQNAIYVFEKPPIKSWPVTPSYESEYNLPTPSAVCLSLFHGAKIETMPEPNRHYWSFLSHCHLLEEWKSRMPQILPKQVKKVLLDATPTPGYISKGGQDWIASMVHDTRIRYFFMQMPIQYLLATIKAIPPSCDGDVEIVLTGTYGRQHRFWLDKVVSECDAVGIHVSIDAEYLTEPSSTLKPQPLAVTVNRLVPPVSKMDPEEHIRWLTACRKMQTTQWSQSSRDLYKSCVIVSSTHTLHLLESILRFQAEPEVDTFDLPPSEVLLRKFVHHIVEDMGGWTESVGEEPDKFVRLIRTPAVRQLPARS